MAGTAARLGDPVADAQLAARLLASAKDRVEHQVTIDAVEEALLPFCSYLDAQADPQVVAVANVQHLATRVEGRLSHPCTRCSTWSAPCTRPRRWAATPAPRRWRHRAARAARSGPLRRTGGLGRRQR